MCGIWKTDVWGIIDIAVHICSVWFDKFNICTLFHNQDNEHHSHPQNFLVPVVIFSSPSLSTDLLCAIFLMLKAFFFNTPLYGSHVTFIWTEHQKSKFESHQECEAFSPLPPHNRLKPQWPLSILSWPLGHLPGLGSGWDPGFWRVGLRQAWGGWEK